MAKTATPEGAAPTTCSSQPLCDDFESDAVGMAPSPTLWQLVTGCTAGSANRASGGGTMIGIDGTQAHSGTKSLRVAGGDSCGWYAITTAAFSQITQQVYVRFYARFSGPSSSPDAGAATPNHNGFLSLWSGPRATATGPMFAANYYNESSATTGQLRLGFQTNAIDWNNIISTPESTLPDQDSIGAAQSVDPPANEWNCFEFHIDESNNHIDFWYNSILVPGLTWNGTVTPNVSSQWATQGPPPLSIQSLGLGWLQLSTAETAWYDDVVISGNRINCQ